MSLVDRTDMDKLRTAAQSAETAASAVADIQLKSIAYQINTAANTGEYNVLIADHILPEVESQLKSSGYKLERVHTDPYDKDKHTVVSWEQ